MTFSIVHCKSKASSVLRQLTLAAEHIIASCDTDTMSDEIYHSVLVDPNIEISSPVAKIYELQSHMIIPIII